MKIKLSVCLLTFNSIRILRDCIEALVQVADELIIVDSGSTDGTLEFIEKNNLKVIYRPYKTHADQMNYAVSQASNDWVLCMDSDEVLDDESIENINAMKSSLSDTAVAYRIVRYWHVLGKKVHAVYPVSSPDYPVRLFNRNQVKFNDAPVDDKPQGFASSKVIIPK